MTTAIEETILETILPIQCDGEDLIAILAQPKNRAPKPRAVLIVVGGPQYRVGSHRQFVLLARSLARGGYATLRFDCRGMGDSSGEARDFTGFERDIACAARALLAAVPGARDLFVWGLCDAASAGLMFATRLEQCAGLVILNPWVRTERTLAKTQLKHYYVARLLEPAFWRKLVGGRFNPLTALRALWSNVRRAGAAGAPGAGGSYIDRMREGLGAFTGPVLCILSGTDLTAKEFEDLTAVDPRWQAAMRRPSFQVHRLTDADHTFSTARWRAEVEQVTLDWLDRR